MNGQPKRGGSSGLGLGEVPTTPHRKNWPCYERYMFFVSGLILWYDVSNGKGTYLREVGREGVTDLIDLVQERDRWRTLVNALMNLRVPKNAGNFVTSCKTG